MNLHKSGNRHPNYVGTPRTSNPLQAYSNPLIPLE